jgi:hypothetical protein
VRVFEGLGDVDREEEFVSLRKIMSVIDIHESCIALEFSCFLRLCESSTLIILITEPPLMFD